MTHRSHQQDERRQAEYWKRRALEAEARLNLTLLALDAATKPERTIEIDIDVIRRAMRK